MIKITLTMKDEETDLELQAETQSLKIENELVLKTAAVMTRLVELILKQ